MESNIGKEEIESRQYYKNRVDYLTNYDKSKLDLYPHKFNVTM